MTSLVFPDINVWLALAADVHVHHVVARSWFESLEDEEELVFCRFTQLGLLRLLTLAGIMGNSVRTSDRLGRSTMPLFWRGTRG
jgi:predicted nucleic acid-binding protein